MILKELCDYYDRLFADSDQEVPEIGWSVEKVAWKVELSRDGVARNAYPLVTGEGKEERRFIEMMVPEHTSRSSGTTPFFCCDNASYLFGWDEKRGTKRHDASRSLHKAVLDGVESDAARALLAFFEREDPGAELSDDVRQAIAEGGLVAFSVDWASGYLHEDESIRDAWNSYRAAESEGGEIGWCSVTGKKGPIARLFPQVTGVPGAQSSGASLISFNFPATESYGRSQAFNASISEHAAFAAGTALKRLMSDRRHRIFFGDTIVVFWADCPAPLEEGIMGLFLGAPEAEDEETRQKIEQALVRLRSGWPIGDVCNPDVGFCLLGLAPNAARLSVRFFERDTMGKLAHNIASYLRDIDIEDVEPISLRRLLAQTAPMGKADNIPSTLVSRCFYSMVDGSDFPAALQRQLIARMRADHARNNIWDLGQRAALLKACLVRKARRRGIVWEEREEIGVSLNRENGDIGYLLGRAFAVMERAQIAAVNPGATIRDRYLATAATSPARVFPTLFGGCEKHFSTMRRKGDKAGLAHVLQIELGKIVEKMPDTATLPKTLTVDEQAAFYIGFYQEDSYLWKTKSERDAFDAASAQGKMTSEEE